MKEHILEEVRLERLRQDRLKAEGKFSWNCADDVSDLERLPVLTEETGEVARAICDKNQKNLREELIQVAAVAIAWVEGLARRDERLKGREVDAESDSLG